MNASTIAAIVIVVLVAVLIFMRRDRARRIGGGDDGTPLPTPPREGGPDVRLDHALRHLSGADRIEITREIASGRKISAIKLVREKTGMGLKEAKEFVEDFASNGDR